MVLWRIGQACINLHAFYMQQLDAFKPGSQSAGSKVEGKQVFESGTLYSCKWNFLIQRDKHIMIFYRKRQ